MVVPTATASDRKRQREISACEPEISRDGVLRVYAYTARLNRAADVGAAEAAGCTLARAARNALVQNGRSYRQSSTECALQPRCHEWREGPAAVPGARIQESGRDRSRVNIHPLQLSQASQQQLFRSVTLIRLWLALSLDEHTLCCYSFLHSAA
jgi:hypothetical protein